MSDFTATRTMMHLIRVRLAELGRRSSRTRQGGTILPQNMQVEAAMQQESQCLGAAADRKVSSRHAHFHHPCPWTLLWVPAYLSDTSVQLLFIRVDVAFHCSVCTPYPLPKPSSPDPCNTVMEY